MNGTGDRQVRPPAGNFKHGLAGMAVLVTGSDVDPFVPELRGRETARHFAACGCAVETMMLAGRLHEIADAEIAAARALLGRVLPPR